MNVGILENTYNLQVINGNAFYVNKVITENYYSIDNMI